MRNGLIPSSRLITSSLKCRIASRNCVHASGHGTTIHGTPHRPPPHRAPRELPLQLQLAIRRSQLQVPRFHKSRRLFCWGVKWTATERGRQSLRIAIRNITYIPASPPHIFLGSLPLCRNRWPNTAAEGKACETPAVQASHSAVFWRPPLCSRWPVF